MKEFHRHCKNFFKHIIMDVFRFVAAPFLVTIAVLVSPDASIHNLSSVFYLEESVASGILCV